jgi:PPP family 3-phenylpropionic acid transporter
MITQTSLNHIRLFYAAYFAAMGLILPFFPVFLDGLGLNVMLIGVMTGLLAFAKVVAPPWVGHVLDRRPDRLVHRFIIVASLLAAVAALLMGVTLNTFALAAIILLFGILWAAILPLTDGLSVSVSEAALADYGRLRVWGSIGFVLASLAGGVWLADRNINAFPMALAGLMLVTALAARGFPEMDGMRNEDRQPSSRFSRPFYLLLGTAFIMQASHGAYYGFFSLYLAAAGYAGWQIGLCWVIGVVAEIVLMWRWSRPLQEAPPALVFSTCLGLAAVRWLGTGLTADPLLIGGLQLLHAASFAAFHVAAIAWVRRLAPEVRHAAAQGWYSAAGFGFGSTVGIMGCGLIAELWGYSVAFYACAAIALLGLPMALQLPDKNHGNLSGHADPVE